MTPVEVCGAEHPLLDSPCILPQGHEGWHRDRIRHYTEWGPQAQAADGAHGKKKKR